MKVPVEDRDPDQRNRVLELYNGGDETIDLGNDQYLLEIYAADAAAETTTVVTPPVLVKKTISLQSDVTFDFDRSEIKPVANDELKQIIKVLNQYEFFSELLISGHTCDLGSDDYNVGLSERRANSVNAFLKRSGLRKDIQVRTEGRGETEPRLPNISKTNRSRNRRVDISFVIRQDADIESSVSKGSPTIPKKYAYSFPSKTSPAIHAVENEAAGSMAAGEYTKGDMDPRQVIGLNGAIEPGETWIIAFDQSDDSIKDLADEVTGQLDFKPNETLVIRRLGGEMALSCRASAYSYTTNYPPQPLIRSPDPSPPPRDAYDEVASPN